MAALNGTDMGEFAVLIFAGMALVSSAYRLSLVLVNPILREIIGLRPFCLLERLVVCARSLERWLFHQVGPFSFAFALAFDDALKDLS